MGTVRDDAEEDPSLVRRERDLYRRLLDLGATEELDPFLEGALTLIAEIAGARQGYLEIQDDRQEGPPLRFWIARHCSDGEVEAIRASFSEGVIAEALATGETIVTASALDDPRFRERGSVREKGIRAVLCAPIGGRPPLGVLYLQQRESPGPFSREDRLRAELFARHLAAFADRLLIRRRQELAADVTQEPRRSLRAEGVIGRSAALAKVLRQLALAAPLDVGVLLTGPSGTGKTQLARILHDSGPRARGPFVELNCAAVPETLLESELFGALPGAHSTATRRVEGKIAAAEGGTLFLDEVGELSLPAQSKLLQFLESRTYYPLGSARPASADVRVVAATNADLEAAMAQKKLREDLYYRLQVLSIRVPSLAERREDIGPLAAHFCARAAEKHRLPELRLSPGALRALEAAEWPGNIRQLSHAIESAAIRAAGEGLILVEHQHLFPDADAPDRAPRRRATFQDATRRFQRKLVLEALEETGWNVTETAQRLDLARSHLYNLIHAFGVGRKRP